MHLNLTQPLWVTATVQVISGKWNVAEIAADAYDLEVSKETDHMTMYGPDSPRTCDGMISVVVCCVFFRAVLLCQLCCICLLNRLTRALC